MANKLTTTTRGPHQQSLFRRPRFWGAVAFGVILAVGTATYLLTNVASVQEVVGVKSGQIHVVTQPEDATILIDGEEQKNRSETTVRASEGRHTVKLQLAGYDDQEVFLDLKQDQTYELEHIFTQNGLTVVASPRAGAASTTTYTNPKFGYTLVYPAVWSADTDESGNAHFYDVAATKKKQQAPGAEYEEALAILAQSNPQNLNPQQFYRSREEYGMEDQSQISQRTVQVAGQAAYQYDTPYGFVPYTITILTGKGQAFLFQLKQGSPNRKIYDEVLGTFKLN